jgi:hypothetical protein
MRIGYAKLGRSLKFNKSTFGFQGDSEAPQFLERLAKRNPQHEFLIIGKNDGDASSMPPNVTNPWLGAKGNEAAEVEQHVITMTATLDGFVMQVGQHGTSHSPITHSDTPWADTDAGKKELTAPLQSSRNYGDSIIKGINALGDATDGKAPMVWIVTDPRNFIKARDIKWPTGCDDILAQYAYIRTAKHERFRDPRLPSELGFGDWCEPIRGGEIWQAQHTYRYGGLELMILPDDWETWGQASFSERLPIGIASTSFSKGVGTEKRRSEVIRDMILSAYSDAEVFGKMDDVSLADLPEGKVIKNRPEEFPNLLSRWRATLSMPALNSSWTVAKPFQCWAANVVTFLHGRLDDHGWILPTKNRVKGVPQVADGLYSIRNDWSEDELTLAQWVRVSKAEDFQKRVEAVTSSEQLWLQLVQVQRALLMKRWNERMIETKTERILGL